MTSYSGTSTVFLSWKKTIGAAVDLTADTLKMALFSNEPAAGSDQIIDDLTGEVSGNGYARQTLTGVDWGVSLDACVLSFDDAVFSASGGNWSAVYWVVFDDTAGGALIAYGNLEEFGSGIIVENGNTLTVSMPDGLFNVQ